MNHALPGFPRTWPQPHIASDGVSRRDFVRICTMAAAAVGLSGSAAAQIAEAAVKGLKASVVWLHFQG